MAVPETKTPMIGTDSERAKKIPRHSSEGLLRARLCGSPGGCGRSGRRAVWPQPPGEPGARQLVCRPDGGGADPGQLPARPGDQAAWRGAGAAGPCRGWLDRGDSRPRASPQFTAGGAVAPGVEGEREPPLHQAVSRLRRRLSPVSAAGGLVAEPLALQLGQGPAIRAQGTADIQPLEAPLDMVRSLPSTMPLPR